MKNKRRFKVIQKMPGLDIWQIFIENEDWKFVLETSDPFWKNDYIFDEIEIKTSFFEEVLTLEEQMKINEEKSFDLDEFWENIKNITNQALEWNRDILRTYVLLKQIEKWVKWNIDKLKDLAYNEYIDKWLNDKDNIAYWYWFSIDSKININYEDDENYREINEKLENRKILLKRAVEQSKNNNTIVDEDWCLVPIPNFDYTSYLKIKKV